MDFESFQGILGRYTEEAETGLISNPVESPQELRDNLKYLEERMRNLVTPDTKQQIDFYARTIVRLTEQPQRLHQTMLENFKQAREKGIHSSALLDVFDAYKKLDFPYASRRTNQEIKAIASISETIYPIRIHLPKTFLSLSRKEVEMYDASALDSQRDNSSPRSLFSLIFGN